MFSLDPIQYFYEIGPCPNCKANLWQQDSLVLTRHKRERYYCFYCGQDYWPGGAINYAAMGGDDPLEAHLPVPEEIETAPRVTRKREP
jgi:hypothetical protein